MKIVKELKGKTITVYLDGGQKITGEYRTTVLDRSVSDEPVVLIGKHILDATKVIGYGT